MKSGKKPGSKTKSGVSNSSGKTGSAGNSGNDGYTANSVNKYTKASAAILIISGLAIVAILFAALFLFPGNLNSESQSVSTDASGGKESLAVQEITDNESLSEFYEEAYVNPEGVIFRVVPTGEGTANYSIEYQIDREYGNDFTGSDSLTGISARNPIELNITKSPGEWVNIHINVTAENGTVVWDSRSGYA